MATMNRAGPGQSLQEPGTPAEGTDPLGDLSLFSQED